MASKNKIEICGEDIHIFKDKWEKLAFTTYRKDYYDELSNVTWTKNGEYLYSSKLRKYLHRYIMEKWYGLEMLEYMDANHFVVDHMNNDGFDCRVSNLEFLPNDENKAKGLTVDKQIEQIRNKVAISIFKDFTTGLYQLTLGFNIEVGEYKDGYIYPVTAIKFLYNRDYREVVTDVRKIILEFNLHGKITPSKLSFIDKKVIYSVFLKPKECEKNAVAIMRAGQSYLVINELTRIHSISYDKGWDINRV